MKAKLEEVFGADLRSLAALRIGLAVLLLVDLGQRSVDLVAHYTDAGLLPRTDLLALNGRRALASAHFLSGAWEVQALLFAIAGLSALALLVGYRTRLATVASWVLFISLNARNPMVVYGADVLMRVTLFWAMFLPLGARWSIDAHRGERRAEHGPRVLSAATVAYLVQIALVYWVTAYRKSAPEWWSEGTALYYALSIDQLATPLGHRLLEYPTLLKVLTPSVLWLEALGPFLLFSPVLTTLIRSLTVLAFVLLHVGIGLTIYTGLFPWISALAMVVFIPSRIWDALGTSPRAAERIEADAVVPPRDRRSRLVGFGVAVLLVYVVLWNVDALPSSPLKLPNPVRMMAFVLRLDQTWNMFAPSPLKDDGWYVIPGRLRSGEVVDVFRGGQTVRWEKPDVVADGYPNTRWRRYMMLLPNHLEYAPGYARYLCRTWNSTHGERQRLEELEIVFVLERTLPDYRRSEPRKRSLYRHTCSENAAAPRRL